MPDPQAVKKELGHRAHQLALGNKAFNPLKPSSWKGTGAQQEAAKLISAYAGSPFSNRMAGPEAMWRAAGGKPSRARSEMSTAPKPNPAPSNTKSKGIVKLNAYQLGRYAGLRKRADAGSALRRMLEHTAVFSGSGALLVPILVKLLSRGRPVNYLAAALRGAGTAAPFGLAHGAATAMREDM